LKFRGVLQVTNRFTQVFVNRKSGKEVAMRAAADDLFRFRSPHQDADPDDSDTATLADVPDLPYNACVRIDRHTHRLVDVRVRYDVMI
jgi:hypothetical protein